jgi:FAD/FMN-containing dehydrogenase
VPRLNVPSKKVIARLTEIVGPANAIADPAAQAPYLKEWRDLYTGQTPLVLRPGSADEVARIMAVAHENAIGVVPQAGNTGLVGGQIPSEAGTEIVVSVERLNRIRSIDPAGASMIAEAGVTLAEAQAKADGHERLFPLSMASEGSCRIGGNLATNAGGVAVLAYGNARALALGLEVVLPDGRIWDGLKALEKDNTGYDLRDLFIGSEGTLGIITAAALRLFPRPKEKETALAALPTLDAALTLLASARDEAGPELTAFEFMCELSLDMVVRHVPGTRLPFDAKHPWYALIEISSLAADGSGARVLERLLAQATEKKSISDAVIAGSLTQSQELWKLRESISGAQKPEGGSIKHDVSVPVTAIPEFIRRADAAVARLCPGARPVPFGHAGDGNVHYNVSQPLTMEKPRFLALWEPMSRAVHDVATSLGGSISAEHGIGRLKRAELARVKSPVELDLMRRIKAALDPKGIMNPGKVVQT